MLGKRLISSLVLVLILVATVFWFPKPVVASVVGVLVGMGLWEFYVIGEIKGYRPFKGYGTSLGIILALLIYFIVSSQFQPAQEGGFLLIPPPLLGEFIYIILFFIVVTVLVKHTFIRDGSSVIANSAVTMLGIMYVSFLFTFIIKLRYIPNPAEGKGWVMALFIITKTSDISAYICGTRWGRHKLIPRISAKKTIEGAISGILGAVIASLVCQLWFLSGLSWLAIIGLGILLSVVGQVGDLVESLIKRDAQVKDSGKLVPGMGGFLDFMDSLLFAGPVMYIYLKLVL